MSERDTPPPTRVIAVLIPAFDEARALAGVLAGVPPAIAAHRTHIVVIDDGSSDQTAAIAHAAGHEVIRLPTNQGKGVAMRHGRARAAELRADVIVALDADGQHDPDCLGVLIAPVVAGTHDMVVGSRYLATSSRGDTPANRYLVRTLTSRYLSRTLRAVVTDPYSGLRAYNRRVLGEMRLSGLGYQNELELWYESAIHGWRVCEIPIPRLYPPHSSKMGARGGKLIGRLRVLNGYLRTTATKRRELRVVRAAPSSHDATDED